jgi:hypothetical protein
MTAAPSLASLLQRFFTERLVRQQRASPHTIASYRDAFRLLLRFAQERLGKAPSSLALDDLDAALVGAFLDHIEQHRATRRGHGMSASPRSTPSVTTWPSASRRISIAAAEFWQFPSSGTSAGRSPT